MCQTQAGYLKLCQLLTQAYLHNQYRGRAEIKRAWLEASGTDGLILLSGATAGDVGQALLQSNAQLARQYALEWSKLFPNRFYIELQRCGHAQQEQYVTRAMALAAELQLPVVATHPIQFIEPDGFKAHEARVCISEGYVLADKRRPQHFTPDQYFKTQAEMQALFADIPSALSNSVEIAKRCNLVLTLGKNYLPQFPTPGGETLEDYLVAESRAGLAKRLHMLYPDSQLRAEKEAAYQARLDFEVGVIIQMGFAGYFLIVADFINWAKNNGVPVGPAVVPARALSSLTVSALPILTLCSMPCCSSVSSTRNGFPCPISISTSARKAVIGSSIT